MQNITADKGLVDEIIRITRKYRETGDTDILSGKHQVAMKLSESMFGDNMKWCPICDLVNSIVGTSGLMVNATNQQVYEAFKLFGITVREQANAQP